MEPYLTYHYAVQSLTRKDEKCDCGSKKTYVPSGLLPVMFTELRTQAEELLSSVRQERTLPVHIDTDQDL